MMHTNGGGFLCDGPEVEQVRATEHARLRARRDGTVEVMQALHADDFQLINPAGTALTKEQYLGSIASGAVQYRTVELDSTIEVRLEGQVALMRYRSQIDVIVDQQRGAAPALLAH